jgi:type II secretory pathway component PulK
VTVFSSIINKKILTPSLSRSTGRGRSGTILIVVMIGLAVLAGMVLVVGRSARVEAMASANHVAAARAAAVERGAEQFVIALLASARDQVMTMPDSSFAAVPVGDAGTFWIVRPDYGDSSMPQYGLVDEASKLNFTSVSRDMLRALPIMPDELPDSLYDWRDDDSQLEGDGAEDDYYMGLSPPYHCKNGNFETVEELLLVRGAYPELLYGDRFASTVGRAPGPQIGGLSENQIAARGLFDFLTVYSREPVPPGTRGRARVGRINLSTAPREVLRCIPGLTDSDADSLVSRRGSSFGSTDTKWATAALGDKAGAIAQYVTTESYQFSADIVAASSDGRAFRRVRIVVDASDETAAPKILYRRDRTDEGWPLGQYVLDSLRAGTLTPGR